jgi:hypothetical protein
MMITQGDVVDDDYYYCHAADDDDGDHRRRQQAAASDPNLIHGRGHALVSIRVRTRRFCSPPAPAALNQIRSETPYGGGGDRVGRRSNRIMRLFAKRTALWKETLLASRSWNGLGTALRNIFGQNLPD